jgi:hypothetical protein
MRRASLLATALASAALCAAPGAVQELDVAKPGKSPAYTFSSPLENGLGVTSLESLRGRPTLFEFWGTY